MSLTDLRDGTQVFVDRAKGIIRKLASDKYDEWYDYTDIAVVWQCKVLKNIKAIMIDNGKNERMYEVTYNGEKDELYIDVYEKAENICVSEVSK
jgi:hypothetical protein